jgi:hypothetical protein
MAGFPVNAGFYGAGKFHGLTDTNGLFILDGLAGYIHEANWVLQKEGYYYSQGTYVLGGGVKDGKLQPWNPVVTTIIRRVVNPIPMYAKRLDTRIPTTNSPCGYDLMVGDWVAPYGRGCQSDFTFSIEGFDNGMTNYASHLSLDVRGCVNGIQRLPPDQSSSIYILCRNAPEGGYESTWTNTVGYFPGKGFFETQGGTLADPKDKRWGYAFRIRSVTNEQGKIVESFYGKVRGPIVFFNCTKRVLQFTYYLNPTPNDRNLEFDPRRNLFKKLGEFEEVSEP